MPTAARLLTEDDRLHGYTFGADGELRTTDAAAMLGVTPDTLRVYAAVPESPLRRRLRRPDNWRSGHLWCVRSLERWIIRTRI